ncbi:MAG: hypothetical protein Q4G67_07675 [Actinomycetia bacterium]|nr:hypothetical protein [Actinomycetes bacterium]
MSFTTSALLLSWLAIVVLALGMAGLLRQVNDLRRQVSLSGSRSVTGALTGLALPSYGPLARLRPAGGGVVIVIAPGCSSCHAALEALTAAGMGPHTVAVSASGCTASGLQSCVSDAGEAIDQLGVPATPYLLAVDADGVIRSTDVPGGPEEVRAFAQSALALVAPEETLS